MTKRNLLLSLVLVLTFIGGFFTGEWYSTNNKPQELTEEVEQIEKKQASKSTKDQSEKEKKQTIEDTEPLTEEADDNKVLMGYVQDFRDPQTIDYSELTHIIFSFAHPTKDGQLLLNGETALNNLRTTVSNAHKQDTKVMLAIGGWFHINSGESYDYFKVAISDPTARTQLVQELVSIADRENLDGIDIDFEHPRSNQDAQNLTSFTKELSNILHQKEKELSIAVNAKVHSVVGTEINNVVYEPSMFQYVDHVNIMAYDGHWDDGYNASNLSPYPYTENIVNYWTNLFDTHQISREKLVLGVPFYAQPEDPNSKQISYATIINNSSDHAESDTVSINGTTYHYNGEATIIKKTNLALDHGFGGMMMWEIGHDAEGSHSLTLAISEVLESANQYAFEQNQ
ncbi:glycoside hydrolase family 18 protein [Bacillus sp. V3B]|uniref:glycosyl hydrolase family 18 protein n=1 Tax=Bacillus sp. V3B TaxID=2804915 RepID=UPI00210B17FF|nr:glycoside hydrolase family 18 protein [Bacillus sp. V3B]MCQ6275521.1 glycoside hydrolase family 18 protein [Bacillus sp. V3B]